MERPVKERLIGAAVLMAAAIILIPEMLSGPSRDSAETRAQAVQSGDGSIKTYTIDLSQTPGAQPPTVTPQPDNRVPPPEQTAREFAGSAEQTPQAFPESQVVTPAASAPRASAPAVTETPQTRQPEAPPRQASAQSERVAAPTPAVAKPAPKPEPPKTPPRTVASTPSTPTSAVPTGKGWAVQLGSYSSEATAERLKNEWRAKGQKAFVMPVQTGGRTLYRVRVGFSQDRAGAEATLRTVRASVPKAAVVPHP